MSKNMSNVTIIDKSYDVPTQPLVPINELRKIISIPFISGTTKDKFEIIKLQFSKFWFPFVTTLQSSLLMITIDDEIDPINVVGTDIQIQKTDDAYISHAIAPFNDPFIAVNPFNYDITGKIINYQSQLNVWFLNKETTPQNVDKTNIRLSYSLTYRLPL